MTIHAPIHRLSDPELMRQQALIGGAWVDSDSGATVNVTDPATGAVLGTVPDMSATQTRAAIEAADAAFADWRRRPASERADLLMAWHDLMIAATEDLALILTLEQGKPLAESRGEIAYGASFIKWFAEEARRIEGQIIPAPSADRRILAMKEPVGVSAIITPWNFPNAMITRKVGPALAAGCTVVVKPSEFTPFSALALGVLAERAGIPAGVINIVTGLPTDIGAELTGNATVRKLSFTGSTRVGAMLMGQCAPTVKRLHADGPAEAAVRQESGRLGRLWRRNRLCRPAWICRAQRTFALRAWADRADAHTACPSSGNGAGVLPAVAIHQDGAWVLPACGAYR